MGKGAKTGARAARCRVAVMRGPVSSRSRARRGAPAAAWAHPMFSGWRLSTSRPSCQAGAVSARRLVLPLGWTGVIFWFSGGDWSADVTRGYALPLLQWLLPWASPEVVDLVHWLARKGRRRRLWHSGRAVALHPGRLARGGAARRPSPVSSMRPARRSRPYGARAPGICCSTRRARAWPSPCWPEASPPRWRR